MTVITTDRELAEFAVEVAGAVTGWPSEIIPLEDGWLVRNSYVEMPAARVFQLWDVRRRLRAGKAIGPDPVLRLALDTVTRETILAER